MRIYYRTLQKNPIFFIDNSYETILDIYFFQKGKNGLFLAEKKSS